MARLSIRYKDGPFVVCATAVFVLSDPESETLILEILEDGATDLRSRVGVIEEYVLDARKGPFFGRLMSIEPCESSHPDLAMFRDRPTLRAVLTVYRPPATIQ